MERGWGVCEDDGVNDGGGEDGKVEEGVMAVGEMENQSWTPDREGRRPVGGSTARANIYLYTHMRR